MTNKEVDRYLLDARKRLIAEGGDPEKRPEDLVAFVLRDLGERARFVFGDVEDNVRARVSKVWRKAPRAGMSDASGQQYTLEGVDPDALPEFIRAFGDEEKTEAGMVIVDTFRAQFGQLHDEVDIADRKIAEQQAANDRKREERDRWVEGRDPTDIIGDHAVLVRRDGTRG